MNHKTIFISWAPFCSRSDILAAKFGGKSYMVYHASLGSNLFTVWLKYFLQAFKSFKLLLRERPHVTFVMSPPIFACIPVWLYCKLTATVYIIDSHTAAFLMTRWKPLLFIHAFFSRHAATTIVTNEYLSGMVEKWRAHATIISDIPMEYKPRPVKLNGNGNNVVFVCSFNPDEPIMAMLKAAELVPEVNCYFTGDLRDADPKLTNYKPPNVTFTGFMPGDEYAGLLQTADSVVSLTDRDHTMQRAAYEAMSLGTPVITSDWPILRTVFRCGAAFVDNTPESIAVAIETILADRDRYRKEIRALREERERLWNTVKRNLVILLEQKLKNGASK